MFLYCLHCSIMNLSIAYKCLAIIKTAAAIISKSLSVISTLVDSAVDLLFNFILIWAARKIKKRNAYKYPTGSFYETSFSFALAIFYSFIGRTRLEPVTIVILSVIMCSASMEVIIESMRVLTQDIDYFMHPYNATSCRSLQDIDMSTLPVTVMVLTVGE